VKRPQNVDDDGNATCLSGAAEQASAFDLHRRQF
jgi:hypothetical protein